jgi:adenine C2-methylase RlmN of 23S rRNA A2503 and tRNA A37
MRLASVQDQSINFVEDSLTGFIEARYVRKVPEYFICYLSSQSGCNRGCKFCHLTATKQTKFDSSLPVDYLSQANKVLKHYKQDGQVAQYVHYNFMARGEALANPHMLENADSILFELGKLATSFQPTLGVKFNVSTIMPKSLDKPLKEIFRVVHPTLYYSLYSVREEFRKKWMPQAMPTDNALALLRDYQEFSKKKIKIHHCFIAGENDGEDDVLAMIAALDRHGLDVEFNLVRYNPYSEAQGQESSDEVIARNLSIINDALRGKVQMIPRVGVDVHASCGTFYEGLGQ